ncbi:uncharacterized protein LOC106077433 [Biomphalaria glabrata]|uniref:Uncharacterized protein LOC106077433 n=1 Tax=Biomphalaria glabrata TaxID=6526 RepID=A0A9W3AYK5_BIOGL|nr:uncharacterized protein LOC106077433 [Biomphalaria glabrata]XP_055892299.1 uncharacterized protein LOC106077433 [Biomphalaria glabrata]
MANLEDLHCESNESCSDDLILVRADHLAGNYDMLELNKNSSLHQSSQQSSSMFDDASSSEAPANIQSLRPQVQTPATHAENVLTIPIGSLDLSSNLVFHEPSLTKSSDARDSHAVGEVGSSLQIRRASSEWQGGIFTPQASRSTDSREQTMEIKFQRYFYLSIVVMVFFLSPIAGAALVMIMKAKKWKAAGVNKKAMDLADLSLQLNVLAIIVGVIGYASTGFFIWYNNKRMEKLAAEGHTQSHG